MAQRHRRRDMERWLRQREREGLTYRELSEESGVPIPTLSYWAAKLRREEGEVEELAGLGLVPVDVVEGLSTPAIQIRCGAGVFIDVELGFDREHLGHILEVVGERC